MQKLKGVCLLSSASLGPLQLGTLSVRYASLAVHTGLTLSDHKHSHDLKLYHSISSILPDLPAHSDLLSRIRTAGIFAAQVKALVNPA